MNGFLYNNSALISDKSQFLPTVVQSSEMAISIGAGCAKLWSSFGLDKIDIFFSFMEN